jgi:hypothetical protein
MEFFRLPGKRAFLLSLIISGQHAHWWPEMPYLAIPPDERRSLLLPGSRSRRQDRDLASLCDPWRNLSEVERFVLVYIPPGWLLSRLKKGFAQLLQRDYSHLLKTSVQGIKWLKSGKGSPKEQWRSALGALSAWRLQEHRYTAREALELARSYRVALYASERSYRNAARKAKARIAELEERLRQFAAGREPR